MATEPFHRLRQVPGAIKARKYVRRAEGTDIETLKWCIGISTDPPQRSVSQSTARGSTPLSHQLHRRPSTTAYCFNVLVIRRIVKCTGMVLAVSPIPHQPTKPTLQSHRHHRTTHIGGITDVTPVHSTLNPAEASRLRRGASVAYGGRRKL